MAETETVTKYTVAPAIRQATNGVAGTNAVPRKVAVLVVHGMGQQSSFRAIEDVAEGLGRRHAQMTQQRSPDVKVRTTKLGSDLLTRAELTLGPATERPREVHVYEGYWAPYTQGKVKLRDVLAFFAWLANKGFRTRWRFSRHMFGKYVDFTAPIRPILVTIPVLASLTIITLVAAYVGLSYLIPAPRMAQDLLGHMTTLFDILGPPKNLWVKNTSIG